MEVRQYDVYVVALDLAIGHEIKKSRPCAVISPDEMNDYISTVIIVPMTTQSHPYPTRIPINFGNRSGWVVLDQPCTVDKRRLVKRLGRLEEEIIKKVKMVIKEMLVD